ncbi:MULTISPECIES: spore germination protein [Bacillus cereus group]|uniref:Spore germination protein n=1 Tax=Bacillus cereus TaxID=1396 RepID=A0A2A8U0Q5_BACCE|nr:spore germination protein [Bacillus cereus]PDY84101.1 spore germination protein [Bacillus cereus]PFA09937.1 spore germination protein [Bacillus cereus]PFM29038.1 spore germination protein [Bacillus cereus]PGL56425.1 spore germination protein [Bacillus cereus]PGQ07669.1 spore germination protein [Bacillus cereus]
MSINMRKIKIINNTGAVNVGDCYNLAPFAVAKIYTGAGGSSTATFLNGKRMAAVVPVTSVFIPPLATSTRTLGS